MLYFCFFLRMCYSVTSLQPRTSSSYKECEDWKKVCKKWNLKGRGACLASDRGATRTSWGEEGSNYALAYVFSSNRLVSWGTRCGDGNTIKMTYFWFFLFRSPKITVFINHHVLINISIIFTDIFTTISNKSNMSLQNLI